MKKAKTFAGMSPGLLRVMDRARRNPDERQFSLAYLIDYKLTRKKAYADDWIWIIDHTIQCGQEKGIGGKSTLDA